MHNREPNCYFNVSQQRYFKQSWPTEVRKWYCFTSLSSLVLCKNSRPFGTNEVLSPTRHLNHLLMWIFKPQELHLGSLEEPGQGESSAKTSLIVTCPTSLLSWFAGNGAKDRNLIAISVNFKSYTCRLILPLPFTSFVAFAKQLLPSES